VSPDNRLRGFDELAQAIKRRRREAEQRAAQARALEKARAEAELQAQRARQLFALTVGPVVPLPEHGRADRRPPPPEPLPLQRERDEAEALRAALSDEVDVESLLLTDDGLSFRRRHIAPDVLARLRRGQWTIQEQIDLHGKRRDEARDALAAFVRQAHQRGHRCLRVVHGKGLGSPGRQPVLKAKVQRWLAQCDAVIAFTQASGPQGGAGALIVLLAP
jgi:DNA-nicking Smr family endonuclease